MGRFKIKGLRWYIAGLLCLVTTINYIDRTSLGVVGPVLREKLHINENEFANIIIWFQFSYLVMQPIAGRIIDWLGTKAGFSLAVAWWSVANILHAFARTPLTFGLFRGLLGMGEAGNFPGVAKTASEWFPPKERTIATGVANVGSGTGALIATPLVAWILMRWGWQEAFVITGATGFLWLVLWKCFYYPPERHPNITQEELDYIKAGQKGLALEEKSDDSVVLEAEGGLTRPFLVIGLSLVLFSMGLLFATLVVTQGLGPAWLRISDLREEIAVLLLIHGFLLACQWRLSRSHLRLIAVLVTLGVVVFFAVAFLVSRQFPIPSQAGIGLILHALLMLVQSARSDSVWRIVVAQRNFWGIALPRFLAEPAWQFFSYWIVMYMMDQKGIDLKQVAYFAWVPFLAADLGSFLGGMLSPTYQKLGLPLMTARKMAMLSGALTMPVLLLVLRAQSPGWAIFWFCFGPFGHNIISSVMLTLPADLFPKRAVATANGLSGCIGYVGGMLFTKMVGTIVSTTHNYVPIFVAMAFMDLVGAAFLFALIREPRRTEVQKA